MQNLRLLAAALLLCCSSPRLKPAGSDYATLNRQAISKHRGSLQQYESKTVVARARQGISIGNEEQTATLTRQRINQQALQRALGLPNTPANTPAIGVACSGGGMRAAIATLGLLSGLEKIGLLDAVTYLATLSGSTWTAASWLQHGGRIEQLRATLKSKVKKPFDLDSIPTTAIVKMLLNKYMIGRDLSINDIYGSLIASTFLSTTTSNGLTTDLGDFAPAVAKGSFPIPIFTSIIGETEPHYEWMEYSPFEVGSTYLKTWIPTDAVGKRFTGGDSYDASPDEHMSYILGICSSAYAGNMIDVVQAIHEGMEADYGISFLSNVPSWLSWIPFGTTTRISPPVLPNFSYKIPLSPLAKIKTLTLVDAGMATNIPCVPLLRRNVPIYIICDAGTDATSPAGTDLREVEEYASRNNLPFPTIDYAVVATEPLSVWIDKQNPAAPVVIHVPNKQDFSTLKFGYSNKEFEELCGAIEHAIVVNKEQILEGIAYKMA
jgi:hypothetical protein